MVGYQPSPEQLLFHRGDGHQGREVRYKVATGGEQAGKSLSAAMELFSKGLWGQVFWIVAPDYEQSRPEMRYLLDAFGKIGAIESASTPASPGPWTITLRTGARIRTISAQDVTRIANESPDGILMVEAAQQPEEAFWRCYGRTGPARGWLCINGTLEGSTNWFANLVRQWKGLNDQDGWACKLPSWSNLAKYPGGRNDEQILRFERTLPSYLFEERFAGNPVPPRGLVHPEFSHLVHVRPMRWGGSGDSDDSTFYIPRDAPLQLWIDPGYASAYAVLAVYIQADTVYVFDELYLQHHTTDEVIDAVLTKPWWEQVERIVADVAAEQHAAMEAPAQVWRERTRRPVTGKKVLIPDGIARTASFLKVDPVSHQPKLLISTDCPKTIWEYTDGYRYPLDKKDGTIQGEKPVDRNNHSTKAIVYGLIDNFGHIFRERKALERVVPVWERVRGARRRFAASRGW